jgi:predicted Zn finger-like uncharacterized protein
MLIQCPACRARSQLPDQSEGARVRCSECGRVFVALPAGARRGSSKGLSSGAWLGIFVGAVGLLGLFRLLRSGGGDKQPVAAQAAPAPAPVAAPADYGWRSELVQIAAALHEAAFARDRERIKTLLHGQRLWQREHESDPASAPAWLALQAHERAAALERWAEELAAGASRELVADWRPYDGQALEVGDDEVTVRVAVAPRAGGVEKRWVEWRLAREGERFKAWSWERWLSPEEQTAERRKHARGYEVTTLSDGSIVHEREPEPLGHLEETPPEVRERIDQLVATMLDLELTKESGRAQHDLVAIGRPAIPILLTKFFETPADSEQNRIRCNLIDQTLQRITGQQFGYAPGEAGSAAGTTEERRASSIKQWFAWWYKNQRKFTEKATSDGLEGLIELTEDEKKWLEKHPNE